MKPLKPLKTFEQQVWHEQISVAINEGAIVSLDGTPFITHNEKALGNIILRLNAQNIYLREEIEKLKTPYNILDFTHLM